MSDFDFANHARSAMLEYLGRHSYFEALASAMRRIIEEALKRRDIKVLSVQALAKDPSSFQAKAALPSDSDPSRPKYAQPLDQITDLAGIRVITFLPGTLNEIDEVIQQQFAVVERSNKGDHLIEEDKFGYQSIHYLVRLSPQRAGLPEYEDFRESITEIQVRTILQHAWAEIEHDIQYKSSSVIPTEIRRRFMALAGLFEIADREFQAIQDADQRLTDEARVRVEAGDLDSVEITPDSLKTFLNRRLGPDGRISPWSYNWTARLLKRLGFQTLEQVEKCIEGYDDDQLSKITSGSRQGQTTRFEYMLFAGMGQRFLDRHLWSGQNWWPGTHFSGALERFRDSGVIVRDYDPLSELNQNRQLHRLLLIVTALRDGDRTRVILVTNNHIGWRTDDESSDPLRPNTAYLLPYLEDAKFDDYGGARYISDMLGLDPAAVEFTIDPRVFRSTKHSPAYRATTDYSFRFAQVRLIQPYSALQVSRPELPIRPHRFEWHSIQFLMDHRPTRELNSDVVEEVAKRFGRDLDGVRLSIEKPVPADPESQG